MAVVGQRPQQCDRLADQLTQIDRRTARRVDAGEIEQLANDLRHFIDFGFDRGRARTDFIRGKLAGHDQPGTAGDDVQRRSQFVGNPGGEAADRLQPIRVAKLFDRGNPGGRLLLDHRMRFGELHAHLVQAFRKFWQFVVRLQMNRAGEIAGGDAARFVDQSSQRPSDHANSQPGREKPADHDHSADEQRRSIDDFALVRRELRHRMGKFQTAAAAGIQRNRPIDIENLGSRRNRTFDRRMSLDRRCRQQAWRRRRRIGVAGLAVEPDPADVQRSLA